MTTMRNKLVEYTAYLAEECSAQHLELVKAIAADILSTAVSGNDKPDVLTMQALTLALARYSVTLEECDDDDAEDGDVDDGDDVPS